MYLRRSTMFLISSILCFIGVILFGFIALAMRSYGFFVQILFLLVCILCLANGIYTFSRYRYYKGWEETKLK
jgi:uncharacterized membrane protein